MKRPLPTGRYVKRNAIDYMLAILLVLLLFSFLFRGIGAHLFSREDRSRTAEIVFAIEGVSREAADLLESDDLAFTFLDNGQSLGEVKFKEIKGMLETVNGPNGEPEQVESQTRFTVSFTLTAEGAVARDGHFLLDGTRRLSAGSSRVLLLGDVRYTAKIYQVTISS